MTHDAPSDLALDLLDYLAEMSSELAVLAERIQQVIPAYHLKLAADRLREAAEVARVS